MLLKVHITQLKELERIIKEENANQYIKQKKELVQEAIQEILKGQKEKESIEIPEKIHFQNFIQILHFFFGEKNINDLNGYGIYFVINFLKCNSDKEFNRKCMDDIKKTISQETLESLIGDGEDWEKRNAKRDLVILGLGEQLEKYDL